MPRKNRQKLHRELRLRAEARKADAKAARDRRRAAREQADRRVAVALVRRRVVARDPVSDATRQALEDLLGRTDLAGAVRKRAMRVYDVVRKQIPEEACVSRLPWYVLLSRRAWAREPEAFVAPRGSVRRKKDALALHLLTRHPVPAFLVRALDVEPLAVARFPEEADWAVGVLVHVGAGRPLKTLVGTSSLPTPLTRRMLHDFLEATADTSPIAALRAAQVRAFGGPQTLATRLLGTLLGQLRGPDPATGEPFWMPVIQWICRHPEVSGELRDLLRFLDARNRAGGWSFKGRTAASVRRDLWAWRDLQRASTEPLPASGLTPWSDDRWAVVELRSHRALREEGAALSNCAFAYRHLVARGQVALWSIRAGGERRALAEVVLASSAVVQLKGAANRPCPADAREVVARWAAANGLAMRG